MDWTGLGQMTSNRLKVKFSETQCWTGQTDCILAFSVYVAFSDF